MCTYYQKVTYCKIRPLKKKKVYLHCFKYSLLKKLVLSCCLSVNHVLYSRPHVLYVRGRGPRSSVPSNGDRLVETTWRTSANQRGVRWTQPQPKYAAVKVKLGDVALWTVPCCHQLVGKDEVKVDESRCSACFRADANTSKPAGLALKDGTGWLEEPERRPVIVISYITELIADKNWDNGLLVSRTGRRSVRFSLSSKWHVLFTQQKWAAL